MKIIRTLIVASLLCAFPAMPFLGAEEARSDLKAFLENRLARAEALLKDEQYLAAVQIADALLVLQPDAAFLNDVRAFRERASTAQIQHELLQCEVIPEKKVYLAGETVRVTIRLRNASLGELRIPLKDKAGAKPDKTGKVPQEPNRLILTANSDDYSAVGSTRKNSTASWNEEIKDEVTLSPGDFWELPVEINDITDGIAGLMARKVTFSVVFAPLTVKRGMQSSFIAPYHGESFGFLVLPKEAAGVVANPEEALKRSLQEANAQGIFSASLLLAQTNRNLALRLLTGALHGARPNSAVESAIITSLQHATDAYRLRTRQAWLTWWEKAWTYYCTDANDNQNDVKIALIKNADSYTITLDGEQLSLAILVEKLRALVAAGVTKAELRCSKDVSFVQFAELHQAVRAAGVRDVSIVYAQAGAP